jgi:hypothetical protein
LLTIAAIEESLKQNSARVLKIFSDMRRDRLDLHVMFESSGNEPAARAQVLDAVDDLVREELLESAGGDFYVLTEKGKQALALSNRAK